MQLGAKALLLSIQGAMGSSPSRKQKCRLHLPELEVRTAVKGGGSWRDGNGLAAKADHLT